MRPVGVSRYGVYEWLTGDRGESKLREIRDMVVSEDLELVFDLETTGLNPYSNDILLVSFTYDGKKSYVFSPQDISPRFFIETISNCRTSNQNIKFDYLFVKRHWGVDLNIEHDTQIMHALATAGISFYLGGNDLKSLAKRYLGVALDKRIRTQFLTGEWRSDEMLSYAASDATVTYALIPRILEVLKASGMYGIWKNIELPLIPVIVDMELDGVNIDLAKVLEMREAYQIRTDELDEKIRQATARSEKAMVACDLCGGRGRIMTTTLVPYIKKEGSREIKKSETCPQCNGAKKLEAMVTVSSSPASVKQMIEFFKSQRIDIPIKIRKTGKESESIDNESLASIDHEVARLLSDYRDYSKALSAFLIPWSTSIFDTDEGVYNPVTNAIHGSLTQVDTQTGRTSMREPNLQQVPATQEFRDMFVAPPGHSMICCDYSQYELRVLAEFSKDQGFIKMFDERHEKILELERRLEEIGEVCYSPEIGDKHQEIRELRAEIEKYYDFHAKTALALFRLNPDIVDPEDDTWIHYRKKAKALSFGIPYGSGPGAISSRTGMTPEEAREALDTYFETFPGVKRYLDDTKRLVRFPMNTALTSLIGLRNCISWSESLGKRRRFYYLSDLDEASLGKVQRAACNQRIQSTNADVTKLALIGLHSVFKQERYADCKLRLTVHDEIVVTAPESLAKEVASIQLRIMKEASENYLKRTPTEVSCNISSKWEK